MHNGRIPRTNIVDKIQCLVKYFNITTDVDFCIALENTKILYIVLKKIQNITNILPHNIIITSNMLYSHQFENVEDQISLKFLYQKNNKPRININI